MQYFIRLVITHDAVEKQRQYYVCAFNWDGGTADALTKVALLAIREEMSGDLTDDTIKTILREQYFKDIDLDEESEFEFDQYFGHESWNVMISENFLEFPKSFVVMVNDKPVTVLSNAADAKLRVKFIAKKSSIPESAFSIVEC